MGKCDFNCHIKCDAFGCDEELCPRYKAYQQGRADAIDEVISYLNDSRLIEDSKGCYECISELMEKIEQLKEQKNE